MGIVFTQDTHAAGDPEWDIWPEHVEEGTWGWEIVDELSPREDEFVIRKIRYDAFYGTHLDHSLRFWSVIRYDAFYGTHLDHSLRFWSVDTLIICGTVANICVHYTAASAALRWYRVIVPRDATSALHPFDLESSLRQTAFLFNGTITESSALVAEHANDSVYRSKIEEAADVRESH
jgi:nicotinamidase-related amidase